ncbi:MAG TPA: ABC transporter permease [Ktedonobacterales bacterium]
MSSIATTPPASQAAPASQRILAQTRAELLMTLRRGESVLVTMVIPVGVLFFAMALPIVDHATAVQYFPPGVLAAAIISTAMVSLGIATAYERYYGVLKRLGSTPLTRGGLILAKILSVLAVEAIQVVLLLGIAAIFYGWRPQGSLLAALAILLIGTATFAGLGLLMAGALRADATLAAANGLFLLFLLVGDVILPLTHLPALLQPLARVLPAAALTDALRGALSPLGAPLGSVLLLIGWGIVILAAAALTFKWE